MLILALVGGLPVADAAGMRVLVDVGHTLEAPGARSARGRDEFEFNRDLARQVVQALHRLNVEATLVNEDGRIASLPARAEGTGPDVLLVSIHHDSLPQERLLPWVWQGRELDFNDDEAGHSLFISARNPDVAGSLLCAQTVALRMQRSGFVPTHKNADKRAYADPPLAIHYYDNLIVLYRSMGPALLFEAGVLKNRDEELLLRDPVRRARMAAELATGIAACTQVLGMSFD